MKHKSLHLRINLLIAVIILIAGASIFITRGGKLKIKTTSGAMESLQFMTQIRAYPNTDIPEDKFYKAFEYSQSELAQNSDNPLPAVWTNIGPNNIGGRSIALAVHPVDTAVVFIGSASGGLWKTTTGGIGASAWTRINTGFPSLAVSSIAIDSVNPNIMYIGTGENYGYQFSVNSGVNVRVTRGMYGIGILKTTNGGTTWTKSLDWSYNNQRGVWDVMINPKNPNVIYAATSEGVYKSTNAGGSWNNILNYLMAMDLLINPVDTNIIYASIGNLSNNVPNSNVGLYKSTNSGASWTKLNNGTSGLPNTWTGKTSLDMFRGNPDVIIASVSNDINSYIGLYRTTNAGLNWTAGYASSSWQGVQGWYNNAIMFKPDNQNIIVGGAVNTWKSTNFGANFTSKSVWSAWLSGPTPPGNQEGPSNFVHADIHYFTYNPKDYNKLYIAADGGLYRSNNFGESFFSCNGGYVTSQFYASFASSFTDSVFCLGGLQDNRAAFHQGTVAWYKTFGGDGACCQINSQNPLICYTEYTYGDVARSTNGGISWNYINPPSSGYSSSYCFVAPFVVCPSNPNILYIAGTNVYKSSNGGSTWSSSLGSFGGGKGLSIGTSWVSTDTVYIGTTPEGSTTAAVWRSVNGGLNWTNISGSSIPNRYPTDIFVHPYRAKEVYATFGGFGSAHVLKSVDAGNSWTNITSNLPDVPHQSVFVDPLYSNNVYVGNDLGVYVSTNGGTNWVEFRNGMPYALVFDLSYAPVGRKLRAATHGNGIWESKLLSNPVGISGNETEIPDGYMLEQNYPNPFNSMTTIHYNVPTYHSGEGRNPVVTIKVYNILGKEVKTLVSDVKPAGSYEIRFDAAGLSSGVYFYKMTADDFSDVKKFVFMK
jgi:photosystem II stability/assembly factor-like uncharacterized protein